VLELGCIPVNFVKKTGNMRPTFGTVPHSLVVFGISHIPVIVVELCLWIVTRWKVDITTQRGVITITMPVGETCTCG
jgi:hypothetical protein